MIWDNIKKIIEENDSFIITTHVNSDGDGLGSELAFHHLLKMKGKRSRIINPTPVAANYSYLFQENEWELFDREKHLEAFREADYLFVLDVSVWDRIGGLKEAAMETNLPIACIDHHPYTETLGKDTVIIDSASSTGELIYELIKSSNTPLNYPMALGIYTSLVNDTGNFRFSNATERVHLIASELLQFDICPDEIYSEIYEYHSINKMKFVGEVLSGLDFRRDGELVIATVPRGLMEKYQIEDWETDGLVDYPRAIKNGRVVILGYERKDGLFKISMRAKDKRVNLNIIAQEFGGGGHRYASGISTRKPMDEILPPLIDAVEKQLVETLETPIHNDEGKTPDDYFNTLTALCKEVINIEYQAAHFYLLVLGKLKFDQEEMKSLIAELYKTESEHLDSVKNIFNQLLNWGKVRFDINKHVAGLSPDMNSLSKIPNLDVIMKTNDFKGIYLIAKGFEEKTIIRYKEMIEEYKGYSKNHAYLSEFLSSIIQEEEKHIRELDSLFLGR